MRFIFLGLIAIVCIVFVVTLFLQHFRVEIRPVAEDITPTPTNPLSQRAIPTSSGNNITPSGFRGPVGQPHIIGPSANPPNY